MFTFKGYPVHYVTFTDHTIDYIRMYRTTSVAYKFVYIQRISCSVHTDQPQLRHGGRAL